MVQGVSVVSPQVVTRGWREFMRRANAGLIAWAFAMCAAMGLAATPTQVWAFQLGSNSIPATELPVQGRDVLSKISEGGPFRYDKDGTVFGNRERLLPRQKRGYYREYTVPTPGLSHRGARRIVCGGEKPRAPDACYYTEDHYGSFRLIAR